MGILKRYFYGAGGGADWVAGVCVSAGIADTKKAAKTRRKGDFLDIGSPLQIFKVAEPWAC